MRDETKIALVVLNWNRSDLTISFLHNILEVEDTDKLLTILVDNGSEASEKQKLLESVKSIGKFTVLGEKDINTDYSRDDGIKNILLLLDQNYGYARGNNFGLKLALELGCKYAVISNNDVMLEVPVVDQLLQCIKMSGNAAVIGPKILGIHNEQQGPYERLTLYHYFFYPVFFPLSWPVDKIRRMVMHSDDLEAKGCGRIKYPYRVMGSLMLVDLEVMEEVGWFDESTFLYAEEPILAEKLLRHGYRMAYTDSVYVRHMHGSSTGKLARKQSVSIALKSELYYLRNYRGYGKVKLFLAKVGFLYKNLVLGPVKGRLENWVRAHWRGRGEQIL